MTNSRIILPLTPVPYIKINSGKGGDHILFSMKEVCEKGEDGGHCQDYIDSLRQRNRAGKKVMEGYCKHTLSESGRVRKWAIERYNKFRMDLFHLAKQAGFQLPSCGMSMYFHFPVKLRASPAKVAALHGQLKLSRPDVVNLKKAAEDSLSTMDEQIAQYSGSGKFWFVHDLLPDDLKKIVVPGQGYIEILLNQPLYNPYDVEFKDKELKISMEDIEVSRQKRKERRDQLKAERKEKKNNPPEEVPDKPLRRTPEKKLFKKEDKIK